VTVAGLFWERNAGAPQRDSGARRERSFTEVSASGPTALVAPAGRDPVVDHRAQALFDFVQLAEAAALDLALPAPAVRTHYVRPNAALIDGKHSPFWQKPGAGRFALPMPDGSSLTIVIDVSESLGADRFTSAGRVEGRPASRALFAVSGGYLHGEIADPATGTHVIRVATRAVSQFYTIDPNRVPPCGGERRKFIDGDVLAAVAAAAQRTRAAKDASALSVTAHVVASPGAAPLVATDNPQRAEAHVMMAVTQAVLPTLAGAARSAALQSAFDLAIARVNADLTASLVTARVRLVKVAETTYDETVSTGSRVQDDALTALQRANDGKMDELHALRDASGADFVCLALNRGDFASSGLAFVLDQPGDNTNALFAFSVVQYASVAGTRVVAHEFGHTFGCAHDRENAQSPGAYPYSYGYRFVGADGLRYRDIMAYPPGIELSYFSNPAVTAPAPVNAPLGIEAGRAGESDAARTFEQAALEVANYRLQTLAPPAVGTLVNIATRAYVGPGERAVIAGFTVTGAQPKTMLLRAAGPALAAFGLGEALANPQLALYAGANRVAENAGWGADGSASAAALTAAARQVGAFQFSSGSGDAALLATLAPGAYTAVVTSGGGTGAVLVEAYETAPAGSGSGGRIVNLSTRAFADRAGHPLIAGFVVRGVPGTTKRMLVRALGPSLARAPFNLPTAMNDPRLELRNAAGDLVLRSDDWSTGAEGGASPVNDFTPLVRYYNEQQIARTGYAPPNRREPCLLVDLPPGNYTVVVQPFERLPDEPAVPGVAVVEVFEIAP